MDARLKVLPPEFVKRLQAIIPPGQFKSAMEGYLLPKPLTFRVNTLKASQDSVLQELSRQQIETQKEKFLPNCYYLKKISEKKVRELDVYRTGKIYLQNFSSQIPPLILDPQPGQTVLDLCASPGSKTTQLAALMQNKGIIVAIEPDEIRFQRLCHNLDLLKADSVKPIKQRGETYINALLAEPDPDPLFDRILVDAPCSGEGTFHISHRASFSHWSVAFVKTMAKQQKKLLHAAIRAVRPGGLVLYATCSLSPEENEEVIDDILKRHPEIKTIPITQLQPDRFSKPALSQWNGTLFHPSIPQNARRIFPSHSAQGFFLCLIKKS